MVVHETGRAAISKLCSTVAGRDIFSAVLSKADLIWEISPQRKDNMVLGAEGEPLADLGFAPVTHGGSFW